jgi:[protein-PII] uridylyltransferase
VARPDLLVLSAFLHDVGKGLPGDHSVVGAPLAYTIALELGLAQADAAQVEKLVRLHLLLPDTATRRDLTDPLTIYRVAELVGDSETLNLLYGLARADAAATGPLAWTEWKDRLVRDLVHRVHRLLDTGEVPPAPTPDPALVAGALPAVHVEGDRVSVAATDRRGLLAAVAGCLALHRLDVVTADISTVDGRALVQCAVESRYGSPPDAASLTADLRRAALGQLGLERVARRGRPSAGAQPRVVWHRDAATDAVVVEVRAPDALGLLYRIARALDEVGAEVRAARISTLGADVVDAFYLVGRWTDLTVRAEISDALLTAIS